jgi:ribosomal protein S4
MRRIRKKFKRPKKPWDSKRISDEKTLMKTYGLRTKRELWRTQEILRQFRRRARDLIAVEYPERQKVLIDRLVKLGMLSKEAPEPGFQEKARHIPHACQAAHNARPRLCGGQEDKVSLLPCDQRGGGQDICKG